MESARSAALSDKVGNELLDACFPQRQDLPADHSGRLWTLDGVASTLRYVKALGFDLRGGEAFGAESRAMAAHVERSIAKDPDVTTIRNQLDHVKNAIITFATSPHGCRPLNTGDRPQ